MRKSAQNNSSNSGLDAALEGTLHETKERKDAKWNKRTINERAFLKTLSEKIYILFLV